jgi:hypothetical protein
MLASEEPREGKAPTRGSGVGAESAMAPPTITCGLRKAQSKVYSQVLMSVQDLDCT